MTASRDAGSKALAAAVGLLVWLCVLVALCALQPLVFPPALDDGGRGAHVEALWMLLGWVPCRLVGAMWPGRTGPLVRRLAIRRANSGCKHSSRPADVLPRGRRPECGTLWTP